MHTFLLIQCMYDKIINAHTAYMHVTLSCNKKTLVARTSHFISLLTYE